MTSAIELAFVIAGLFALMWAIMSPNAGRGSRAAAGTFGVVALLVAMLLHGEDREDRYDRWG
jgi:drug/metabolite transporter superfamily protein YnfA